MKTSIKTGMRAGIKAAALERKLGYPFRNPALCEQALTHRSFSAAHNERLEFLGDSILNSIITVQLYQRFPEKSEGELSQIRANLVKQQTLVNIGKTLPWLSSLRLGEGEIKSGGFQRPSILADAFEAIIGAIYLDGGYEACVDVVVKFYQSLFNELDRAVSNKDAKTQLQEFAQANQLPLPLYEIKTISGAAHEQYFAISCCLELLDISGIGHGRSRREAEQQAASIVLSHLPQLKINKNALHVKKNRLSRK